MDPTTAPNLIYSAIFFFNLGGDNSKGIYPITTKCSSTTECFEKVIKDEDPLLIGVGEAHVLEENNPNKSSAEYFGKEFVPVLARYGFKFLVAEILQDDPQMPKELKKLENGKCGTAYEHCPLIYQKVNAYDARGTAAILEAAKRSYLMPKSNKTAKIKLYPGGLSLREYKDYKAKAPLFPFNVPDSLALRMGRLTRKHFEKQIKALISKGKVVAYSGFSHNDIESYQNQSFVPGLSKRIRNRYVEVDIVTRETLKHYLGFYPERKAQYKKLMSLLPKNANQAVLVQTAPKRYFILTY